MDMTADVADLPLGALGERMGLRLLEVSADRVVGTLPVEGNTQPYGLLHGGASAVLAEQLGTVAAQAHAGPGRSAVGVELNASHHRAATSGTATGVATALSRGRTLATISSAPTSSAQVTAPASSARPTPRRRWPSATTRWVSWTAGISRSWPMKVSERIAMPTTAPSMSATTTRHFGEWRTSRSR